MDIDGAERKLRQARFFLAHLGHASKEGMGFEAPEQLGFYFSACLSAAQSIYYVLQETGGATFREVQKRWRSALPEPERSWFGRMIGLRDNDVHLAAPGAEALPKYVKENPRRYTIGGPMEMAEMENPDGTKVSGPVLRGVLGLYLDRQGKRVEVTDACREFIGQLSSLVEEMKTATRQDRAEGAPAP